MWSRKQIRNKMDIQINRWTKAPSSNLWALLSFVGWAAINRMNLDTWVIRSLTAERPERELVSWELMVDGSDGIWDSKRKICNLSLWRLSGTQEGWLLQKCFKSTSSKANSVVADVDERSVVVRGWWAFGAFLALKHVTENFGCKLAKFPKPTLRGVRRDADDREFGACSGLLLLSKNRIWGGR
jgi:hypothetical protein